MDAHVKQFKAFVDAGYEEVYVSQISPDQWGFVDFHAAEFLPRLRSQP